MTKAALDWLEGRIKGTIRDGDLSDVAPGLDDLAGYQLQIDLVKRWTQSGSERLLGYKAAFTNVAMQRMYNMSGPTIGSLVSSNCFEEGATIPVGTEGKWAVEPEVLVLLKRDLEGPGVRVSDVLAATEGLMTAIELATPLLGGPKRSRQMGLATSKFTGCNIFGTRMFSPHNIDLRLEGCVLSINGESKGSATAIEVLGDPLRVVALVANQLAELGEKLHAGMVVMTGSVVAAVPVKPGDEVLIEFTRLGSMRAKVVNSDSATA